MASLFAARPECAGSIADDPYGSSLDAPTSVVSRVPRGIPMTSVPISAPFWPVPITTVGRALGGTVVFVREGKLHVTCFLKSTFQLVPDGPMQLTQPEDIVLREVPHGDDLLDKDRYFL